MPRADEPRVVIRLASSEHALLTASAAAAGVRTSTLIREAAVRYGPVLAQDLAAGRTAVAPRAVPR